MTTYNLKESIKLQREMLSHFLANGMHELANNCAEIITSQGALEELIQHSCPKLTYCKNIFVLDSNGVQITDNVSQSGLDHSQFGRDRSNRPYLYEILKNSAEMDFTLSDAYISINKKRPSLTAIQTIRNPDGSAIGFLGADFDIRELPHSILSYKEPDNWRQVKGDPAIRGGLFLQYRAESVMDTRMDEVLAIMAELITEQGVFHGEFHLSSSRCVIWQIDDPLVYRLLTIDDLTDPDMCLVLPSRPYPENAIVPEDKIMSIFEMFRNLRFADENIYLRSGSLNIMNGMVGLNFSCDGSHYMPYNEFLEKNTEFWFGKLT
jgi:hypothetical protein